MRSGIANLPLHWGKAPRWLFSRMVKLAREITITIVNEYGAEEMLARISNPYWFQSLGCVLGYDWHSSGLTTVTCGALKEGIKGLERELGFFIAGGKGGASRKTPREIEQWAEKTYLGKEPTELIYASKMSAKVDSTAIQDGYQLYHHNFFFTKTGSWAVVQQGMPSYYPRKNYGNSTFDFYHNTYKPQYARRYHWYSENISSFTLEPKTGICDDRKLEYVLNLTSENSQKAQKVISEISIEKPHKIIKEYKRILELNMPSREWIEYRDIRPQNLGKVLLSTYEQHPVNFEQLLNIKGLGPKALRALTLIAELTFGTKADWEDPVKYSFAHGGKDGYPYPVDRETYNTSVEFLKQSIRKSKISSKEKNHALLRLLH